MKTFCALSDMDKCFALGNSVMYNNLLTSFLNRHAKSFGGQQGEVYEVSVCRRMWRKAGNDFQYGGMVNRRFPYPIA
ncbi:MAG TPA: hypothetical protein DEB43_07570 [Desulfovibrio sp.]|nr:hypothetical protein [Desulfovibrio sp.]